MLISGPNILHVSKQNTHFTGSQKKTGFHVFLARKFRSSSQKHFFQHGKYSFLIKIFCTLRSKTLILLDRKKGHVSTFSCSKVQIFFAKPLLETNVFENFENLRISRFSENTRQDSAKSLVPKKPRIQRYRSLDLLFHIFLNCDLHRKVPLCTTVLVSALPASR